MRRATLFTVLLAAVLAGACSQAPSDEALMTEVKARLFSDAQVKSVNLTVTAKDGVITLAGEVPNEAARYQAFKLATETKGVTRVDDRMTLALAALPAPLVEPPAPAPVSRPASSGSAATRPATATPPPAAITPAPAPSAQPTTPAAEPPRPIAVEIPAGTEVAIRMIDSIDTEINKTGDTFKASLDAPIVIDGKTVVPTGSDVTVEITESKSAGRMAGRSELRLQAVKLQFQGKSYTLASDVYEQTGAGEGKRTATKVGVGAAAGAAIGAIAGGGKGAAIGAAIGAGGGTAVSAAKKGEQIRVASEARLSFTLQSPVMVTYMPDSGRSGRR